MITDQLPPDSEILIVDDIPHNIRLLSKILTSQGYVVRKALSGKMAFKSIEISPPDLIILDINMPEMDGYQVCEKLKLSAEYQQIPVIFLSALNKTIDKVRAFNLGCVDFITKPFQVEEVLMRIKTQLLIQNQQQQLLEQNEALKEEIKKRELAEVSLISAIQELERLAIIDSLTKVANRRRFDQYLEEEWSRMMRKKQELSLIICDIDYFKAYNDYYGHLAGDRCLTQVAQLLVRCPKRSSDLLARYGAEEFAVILPDTSIRGAMKVATAIRDNIQQARIPHKTSKVKPYVTLSIGVSTCIPDRDISFNDLIVQADKALYESKGKGRNQITVNH